MLKRHKKENKPDKAEPHNNKVNVEGPDSAPKKVPDALKRAANAIKDAPDGVKPSVNNKAHDAEKFLDNMPDVSPNVDRAIPPRPQSDAGSKGDGFDPKIHRVNSSGDPVLKKDGTFAKKPGGAGKKAKSVIGTGKQDTPEAPEVNPDTQLQARLASGALFAIAQRIGGPSYAPIVDPAQGIDERAEMNSAFTTYIDEAGGIPITPGRALLITIGAYGLSRFAAPDPKKGPVPHFKKFFKGLYVSYSNAQKWISKKFKRNPEPPAPPEQQSPDNVVTF